jgi:hypothetical protein
MTEPRDDNEGRAAPGAFGAVLGFVAGLRSWQQVAILLVVGTAGLVGVMLYQGRERIIEVLVASVQKPPQVGLVNQAALEKVAHEVSTEVGPDFGTLVYSVELQKNRRTVLAWAAGDVPIPPELDDVVHAGTISPLFVRTPGANKLMVDVLNGEETCGEPYPLRADRPTFPYVCVVGIPPGPGILIGMLGTGFPAALHEDRQAIVKTLLRAKAERLLEYH